MLWNSKTRMVSEMTRWEELGMTAEEYVRSRWDYFDILTSHRGVNWRIVMLPAQSFEEEGRAIAISAAATFTAEHEEAIRQKREEIGVIRDYVEDQSGTWLGSVFERILAVLEGQLEGMLKGWRE